MTTDKPFPIYRPLMHWFAVATTAATLLLIFMGGLVTSHGAGMSVPDWPNSFGYNMFTFPMSRWVGGIFYEHTHRLMATVVGICSIVLFVYAWFVDRENSTKLVCWLTVAVLLGVIFQGALGGFRVVLVKLGLAIIHACVAQAFLCLVAATAVVTSRWWVARPGTGQASAGSHVGRRFVSFALVCVGLIYGQLILGALMRHHQAGLAIPDFPLNYGRLIPPIDNADLMRANALRVADPLYQVPDPQPVTLGQIWLHFSHRCGALLVTCALCGLIVWSLQNPRSRFLVWLAWMLAGLLVLQVTLGILTVLWRKPADIASLHVATGAAVLMTTFVLYLAAARMHRLADPSFTASAGKNCALNAERFLAASV